MTWQLANAKVWDGSQWVAAVGGGGQWTPLPVSTWTAFTTVTASTSAHTKGAWVELIASTSAAADCVQIAAQAVSTSNTNTATLLDIGIGAAGAETAIVQNVAIGGAAAFAQNDERSFRVSVPVYVPAGSRVAARIQSVITLGKTAQISVRLGAGDNPAGTSTTAITLGTSTATSAGTSLPSGTAWTQFVASTAAAYSAITILPSVSNATITAAARQIELGIGASGSEVAICQCDFITAGTEAVGLVYTQLPVDSIPAGTRLSVRYTANATANASFCVIATEVLGL